MNIYEMPVFGPADLLDMMADDELAALAADIKANGLRQPIVIAYIRVNDQGPVPMLIDGRNRRAACKLAGLSSDDITTDHIIQIDPDITDPLDYVNSADTRRDLTKSQRAMLAAKRYPEPKKTGRGKKSPVSGDFIGVTQQRLSEARKILKTAAPDMIEAVLRGDIGLDKASAKVRKDKGSTRTEADLLARLRDDRPDLAEEVETGAMTLEDARKQAKDDDEARRTLEYSTTKTFSTGFKMLDNPVADAAHHAAHINSDYDDENERITPSRARQIAEFLVAFAAELEGELPDEAT